MSLDIQQTDSKICLQILDIWARMKSTIEQFADEHDLTIQQVFVLYHLCNQDHILMGTLAKQLHCDASNVTGMVDRLQFSGLITRHELPNDRRAKQLEITGKGRALIESLVPCLPASIGMQDLTSDETDRLYNLLYKLTV